MSVIRGFVATAVVCLPAIASGEEGATATFDTHVGLGAPFGDLAASLEYAPDPHFSVALGGGVAVGGVQSAVMGRYRFSSEGWIFGVGGGFSAGGYRWHELSFDGAAVKQWDVAYWANGDVSLEKRASDLRFRIYAGVGRVLNGDEGVCVEEVEHCEADHGDDGLTIPYLGISLGYVWDL